MQKAIHTTKSTGGNRVVIATAENRYAHTKSIAIQLSRGIIEMVELPQVVFIEADENISIVHMAEGKTLLSHKNFGHYLALLSDNIDFIQISKVILSM